MSRGNLVQQAKLLYPWMPNSLIDVFVDAWIEFGDRQLALQEVRNGEGRQVYDQVFPGNRREDGTLKLNEQQYMSITRQYKNILSDYGLNPDPFEDRIVDLLEGEVSPREFEQRVDAVQQGIVQRSDEVRQAFAEASGISNLTDEALLAAALDPEVGNRLFEREISVAQITGTAQEFGFNRSRADVEDILEARDITLSQARQFFSQAESQLRRLNTIGRSVGRDEELGIEELEEATLEGDIEEARNIERLLRRERAAFGRRSGILSDRTGALLGLRNRP